jgi:hypothetical protein
MPDGSVIIKRQARQGLHLLLNVLRSPAHRIGNRPDSAVSVFAGSGQAIAQVIKRQ